MIYDLTKINIKLKIETIIIRILIYLLNV